MKIAATTTFEEIDEAVFAYVKYKKIIHEKDFDRLAIFGIKAMDLLRYFNDKTIVERWGEEFANEVYCAIEKIYERFIPDSVTKEKVKKRRLT
ncbi:MAG TPA: hypothetical protein VKG26_00900 [Bacteroidia bacterium]|nr:hypothetical protein [Bacteroidia bacterium]